MRSNKYVKDITQKLFNKFQRENNGLMCAFIFMIICNMYDNCYLQILKCRLNELEDSLTPSERKCFPYFIFSLCYFMSVIVFLAYISALWPQISTENYVFVEPCFYCLRVQTPCENHDSIDFVV